MKDYIQGWADHMLERQPQAVFPRSVEVVGEKVAINEKHQFDHASIRAIVEPSSEFEVVNEVADSEELRGLRYPDYFIYGLLDTLMTFGVAPTTKLKITLKEISYHPIEAMPITILRAGRDAGQKLRSVLTQAAQSRYH